MGTHPIFESDFDCQQILKSEKWIRSLVILGGLGLIRANEMEQTLSKFVFSQLDVEKNVSTPCLRAEFQANLIFGQNEYGVPALNSSALDETSNCGRISFSFKAKDQPEPFKIELNFEEYNRDEKDMWKMKAVVLTQGEKTYSNNSVDFINAPLHGTYGQSFLCTAGFDISLRQTDGDYTVRFNLKRLQLQPFKVPEDTFANPVICQQDISVVVPAIVGSILGLLVVIVLVTYVIGRRRTRIAYQEI